jgi:hypothetical protein
MTLVKNFGLAVPIFPSLILAKKLRTQYIVARLSFNFFGYLDISQSKTIYLSAMLIT